MSDRDTETGQFVPAEPLFGKEAIEHEAGLVPYKEEDSEDKSELTAEDAAALLDDVQGTPEGEIKTYSTISDLPENVTLTPEQAAELMSKENAAEAKKAEEAAAEKIRNEVDELRGEKPAEKPSKDQPEDLAAKEQQNAAEIDPDIEKALSHPKIKQALDAHVSQVENARQQYSQAVDTANDFARLSFAENFPEIATLPPQQWEGALVAMAQQEPERFRGAINSLNRVAQLQAARQQQQAQQQQREQIEFQQYAKAEDARFAELVKGETPAQMKAIEAEIPQMLSELGVDPLEFLKAGNESRFLRTAAAQKVLVDAAKYRLIQKAPMPVPTRAPTPPVQRPGVRSAVAREYADAGKAMTRLNQTGSIDDALAALTAQRGARR